MVFKLIFLLAALSYFHFNKVEGVNKHKLVVYWGQNAVYNLKKEKEFWEKDLLHFCKNTRYDTVVLAFMHVFFDARQKDSMPGMNFAFHCEKSMNADYPFLYRCPEIEEGIKECQARGKQVLMSLGGATGSYGFQNDAQATKFANTVFHLLLEGDQLKDIRPFGSAILDGVDLDIEGGTSIGYSAFIRELYRLTRNTKKKYIIAAAPQCPFPDAFLGPSPGKAFQDVPTMIDEIYVQFYNNYCHTGNSKEFYPNFAQWLGYSSKNNGPMIYIGVPSHERAAYGSGFWRTPAEMAVIYQKVKDEPRFGGFMFWDASFDQNNVIGGKPYSEHVINIMRGSSVTPTEGPVITKSPTTKTAVPSVKTTKSTTFSTNPTKPGSASCSGLTDGIYAHPTECTMFFQCQNGKFFLQNCPAGLKFNPAVKLCDWPQNVSC